MIKVAIIGAGFMGSMHTQVYQNLPNAELAAIVDVDLGRAEKLAKKYGTKAYSEIKDILIRDDIDVVDICLPTFLHLYYTVEAAKAEKHVFCEKPIALNLKDADKMIEEVKKKGVKFMVGHVLRFWPEYVKIKRISESGKLGKPVFISCKRLTPTPGWAWQDWLTDTKRSGGVLVDLHIHDVDFLLYLLGKPTSVYSKALGAFPSCNHVVSTFNFPQGRVGVAEGGWNMPESFPFTASLAGLFEKGAIEFNNRYERTLAIYSEDKEPEYPQIETQLHAATDVEGNITELGGYFSELRYFIDCLEKGEHPDIAGGKVARDALEVVLLAKKSLKTGEVVEV